MRSPSTIRLGFFLLAAVGLAALAAPKGASTAPVDAGKKAPILASLQRTACYGTCPIYKVTVRSDGTVEYDGERFVKVTGHQVAKLDPSHVEALRKAFADAKFFKLKGSFDCHDETDNPSVILTYRHGKQSRTIRHYHGCRRAPESLGTLEKRMDEIIGTARWVETDDEQKR